MCSWMGGILSGGLRDENLCGQEGQEAKKRRALNTPLFSRHASCPPSHRIRLDKTRTRGREGWQPHPSSHEVAQHVQAWSLAAGMVRDSPGRSHVVRSLLSFPHARMYVHSNVTYVHSRRYRDMQIHRLRLNTCHPRHPDALHTHHTSQLLFMQACRHVLASFPAVWMDGGVWARLPWAQPRHEKCTFSPGKTARGLPRYRIVHTIHAKSASQRKRSAVTDSRNAYTGPTGSAIPQLSVSNSLGRRGRGPISGLITPWVPVGSVWHLGPACPGIGY